MLYLYGIFVDIVVYNSAFPVSGIMLTHKITSGSMKSNTAELPESLTILINFLENVQEIDCDKLTTFLKSIEMRSADYLPFNYFDHPVNESYGRNKISEGRNYSIFLMSWAPGDFTAIHSHGLSDWGAVCFFGDTTHRLYKADGNRIELVQKGIVPAGTVVPVTGNLVHAMGNMGDNPIMSLHIYGSDNSLSNANDDSEIYEIEKHRVSTTNGSAFLNSEDKFIKKWEKGIVSNSETISDYFEIIKTYYSRNKIVHMADYIDLILRKPELFSLEPSPLKEDIQIIL